MAIPSRVLAIDGEVATIDSAGTQRAVSLALMEPGSVAVGDWLLVQFGRFAVERLDEADALAALALLDELAGSAELHWGTAA
jgi:hydrogenase expression/formation protein HypC